MELHTIGSIATVIHQTLAAEGVDADELFKHAGVAVDNIHDPSFRLTFDAIHNLTQLAGEASSNPCLGLSFASYVHPTTFSSLGLAMLASETLRELLEHLVRYYRLVTNKESLTLEERDGRVYLSVNLSTDRPVIPIRVDGWAAIIMKILQMGYDIDYTPLQVELHRPAPEGNNSQHQDHFGCPVIFDAKQSSIILDATDLDKPLPASNPELVKLYDDLTVEYLRKLDRSDFPSRVETALTELLPSGKADKEIVASKLNVSARTLYNKLQSAGTSYKEILNKTRFNLTKEYLEKHIPMPEIAYLLGFSDYGNFSRAFKSWTGQSPRDYRAELDARNISQALGSGSSPE